MAEGRLLLRTQRIWRRWAAGERVRRQKFSLSLWHQPQRIGWQAGRVPLEHLLEKAALMLKKGRSWIGIMDGC